MWGHGQISSHHLQGLAAAQTPSQGIHGSQWECSNGGQRPGLELPAQWPGDLPLPPVLSAALSSQVGCVLPTHSYAMSEHVPPLPV